MRSSEASSPSCRSKKPNLPSSKTPSSDPISLSSRTPEKPPELTRRMRNRGVALSVADIRKVAEGLQDRRKPETTPSEGKTARRQISLPSPLKPKKTNAGEAFKLPEKYEILGDLFHSLGSTTRLLRMKGKTPSFANITAAMECLTDRRFTHGHLAQLKFILPEAIVIKKVLAFDERTSCMTPELHVIIDHDAVESNAEVPPSIALRKLFRSRLIDFCKSHPEVDDIPEEVLPEPFNRPKQDPLSDILTRPASSFATETQSDAGAALPQTEGSAVIQNNDTSDNTEHVPIESLNQQPVVASHISQSFRKRFSQKCEGNVADIAQKKLPSDSFQPMAFPVSGTSLKDKATFVGSGSNPNALPAKLSSEAAGSEVCPTVCTSSNSLKSSSALPATPSKIIDYTGNQDGSLKSIDAVSTPAKAVSTPSRPMSVTPALPPPKRQFMSPDDNSQSSSNKLVRRPPRSRALKFDTPVKSMETENDVVDGGLSTDDDVFDILPESLLQSIREKELKAMEDRHPAISEAKRRQKMIARLPNLFNMIRLLFQTIKRSVITKEELVSKIISSHCDIVDRREVEEQLNLLLELAPEWISEKLASSGDCLFCINKMVNAETIRTSLEEAK